MVMSCHQRAWRAHNLLRANKCLENAAKFKYSGTTVTNQIAFMKKLRTDKIPGMFATKLHNFLPYCPLLQKLKIKIYKNIILRRSFVWV